MVIRKILVTGGAGFVGSHLCEELVKNSHNKVYSLDNYFTGSVENHIKNVEYIKGDTSEIDKLINFTPDKIYHLGEYSRVEQSFLDVDKVWRFNKIGTYSVLEFARKNGAKFIYAGSSSKFGDGGLGKKQSPYAWSKSSNTELVENYGEWFNIDYAIVYFYNVYGAREISSGRYATLIALFREKMRKGEVLTVVNPGLQKRNFTHIDDIISGLILVGENGKGNDFGIGAPESFSVHEIAKMFGGKIIMLPERAGNRMNAELRTSKTEELGWECKNKIVDYINQLRINNWKKCD
jgi:UDP-glucose 4-epimerase